MYRSFLLAMTVAVAVASAAGAQSAYTQTAGAGNAGSDNSPTWGDINGPSQQTGKGKTTNRLLAPDIPGISSQTATGAPIAGTYIAPANLALQNQGQFVLPKTNLDSFVWQSGMNPNIYQDEGENDIPPYFQFTWDRRIERGIEGSDSGLTTGHRSDAPSSWDYPQ